MPGFAAPGVLFAGNSAAPERAFYRAVFAHLPARGYTRYVEVGVGSFAATLVAANAGVPPSRMETSDVTLYTAIVGSCIAGRDLADLDVRLDGEPVALPDGEIVDQAAYLLYVQLLARTRVKDQVDYWHHLVIDLERRAAEHQKSIRDSLAGLVQRLAGLSFTPMCMWRHIRDVADDPHAVIVAAPPSYKSGFEKFFDTGGALTWAEPEYEIFDPEVDMQRLADTMAEMPALLMFLQEDFTGKAAHPQPVFAHPLSPGRTAYVVSNRPDEIFAITGGPKVSTRGGVDTTPADQPILPYGYDVTDQTKIQVVSAGQQVVDYYRDLWMHRLAARNAASSPYNLLLLLDGQVAGVIGYSIDTMKRARPNSAMWSHHLVMRFALGAPHPTMRLTRLATMAALQKPIAATALGVGAAAQYLAASIGLITVEMTRHPEAKGLRGLMKLNRREPHPDGHRLVYEAPWSDTPLDQVLVEFCAKERKWQKSRANAGR